MIILRSCLIPELIILSCKSLGDGCVRDNRSIVVLLLQKFFDYMPVKYNSGMKKSSVGIICTTTNVKKSHGGIYTQG
jgi:hypothetical protein